MHSYNVPELFNHKKARSHFKRKNSSSWGRTVGNFTTAYLRKHCIELSHLVNIFPWTSDLWGRAFGNHVEQNIAFFHLFLRKGDRAAWLDFSITFWIYSVNKGPSQSCLNCSHLLIPSSFPALSQNTAFSPFPKAVGWTESSCPLYYYITERTVSFNSKSNQTEKQEYHHW